LLRWAGPDEPIVGAWPRLGIAKWCRRRQWSLQGAASLERNAILNQTDLDQSATIEARGLCCNATSSFQSRHLCHSVLSGLPATTRLTELSDARPRLAIRSYCFLDRPKHQTFRNGMRRTLEPSAVGEPPDLKGAPPSTQPQRARLFGM